MRVAFLADALDRQYAGVHIYLYELLKALSRLPTKNEYLIVRAVASDDFDGLEELVVPFRAFPGYKAYRLFWELPRLLQQANVAAVIEPAHFGPFNLPKRIKRVTVIHDLTPLLFPHYHVFHSQLLQRWFLPGILRRADHILTNSAHTQGDLIKFFPKTQEKSSAILLGKDESYRPIKSPKVLKQYGISSPYILHVGTLEPRKNLVTLIKAFHKFKRDTDSPHQLVLLGKKGWKSSEIYEAIEASADRAAILLPGYVEQEDLPAIYGSAAFFVYPSYYEGFGLPILEAMACGLPVITSGVSSLPEVGGAAALYFDPHNVDQLAKLLTKLATDPLERSSRAAASLTRAQLFSWDQTAKATDEVLYNLISS
ncbi:MAG: glycosyltransferase family 4 protein [Saprospiraceae bacterium]|nr:glycosyltransferase family 4 protein [Saprospiraceae bacterium]